MVSKISFSEIQKKINKMLRQENCYKKMENSTKFLVKSSIFN